MWIMTSAESIKESRQNKTGKNKGKRKIWFNNCRKDKKTGDVVERCAPQFRRHVATTFERLIDAT